MSSIRFLKDHRGFKAGETVTLREGVNVIVGDQGTGKSTLLAQLRPKTRTEGLCEIVTAGGDMRVLARDFERENPRAASSFGMVPGMGFGAEVASRFVSHGQFIAACLDDLPHAVQQIRDNTGHHVLVLLDEPDIGLSPRSTLRAAETLRTVAAGGSQVLATAHNPWLIAAFPEVLSMEHRRWMRATEYLDAMHTPKS